VATAKAKKAVLTKAAGKFDEEKRARVPAGQTGGGRFTSVSVSASSRGSLSIIHATGQTKLTGALAKEWGDHLAQTYGLKGADIIKINDDDLEQIQAKQSPKGSAPKEAEVDPPPKAAPRETKVKPSTVSAPKEGETPVVSRQAIVQKAAIAAKKKAEEAAKVAQEQKAAEAARKVADEKAAKKADEEKAAIAAKKVADEKKSAEGKKKPLEKTAPPQFKTEAEGKAWFKRKFKGARLAEMDADQLTRAAKLFDELAAKTGLPLDINLSMNGGGKGGGTFTSEWDGTPRSMSIGFKNGVMNTDCNPKTRAKLEKTLSYGKDSEYWELRTPQERLQAGRALAAIKAGRTDFVYSFGSNSFENRGEGTLRHEFGHYFHFKKKEAVVKYFGDGSDPVGNLDPKVTWAEERATAEAERKLCRKYFVSTYGATTFKETIAENFSLYSAGKTENLHPDMIAFFRKNTDYGY